MNTAFPFTMTVKGTAANLATQEGSWVRTTPEIGAGIALGAGVGAALAMVFGDLAIGIALGAGVGAAIGAILGSAHSRWSSAGAP